MDVFGVVVAIVVGIGKGEEEEGGFDIVFVDVVDMINMALDTCAVLINFERIHHIIVDDNDYDYSVMMMIHFLGDSI